MHRQLSSDFHLVGRPSSVIRAHRNLIVILVSAFLARLLLAGNTTYGWDEERDWLLLAQQISLTSAEWNLPIRGDYHNALAAYFLKASGALFGESHIGFRFLDILAGVATVGVIYQLALALGGSTAASWSGLVLALNEYHISVSSLAIQKSFYLLAAAASIYFFYNYVRSERAVHLYLTAALLGVSFLLYEISVLLIAAFFIVTILAGRRKILLRREFYIAAILFGLIVAPDFLWNLLQSREAAEASYSDHLSRVGGIGFSVQPLLFYINDILRVVFYLLGSPLYPTAPPEYIHTNSLVGILLLGAVSLLTIRYRREGDGVKLLLVTFWFVFVFFMLIAAADPARPEMDPSVWFWVDVTLLPSCILLGVVISRFVDRLRYPLVCGAILLTLYVFVNVSVLRFGIPWAAVRFAPEFIYPDQTSRLVEIHAGLEYCDFCSPSGARLSAINLIEEATGSSRAAIPGGEVAEAELGQADTQFRLLADERAVNSRYEAVYEVEDRWGRALVLDDYPYGANGVRVVSPGTPAWKSPFWLERSVR